MNIISEQIYTPIKINELECNKDIINELPLDIASIIFKGLSAQELATYQLVSKFWKSKVDNFFKRKCISPYKPENISWQRFRGLLAGSIDQVRQGMFTNHVIGTFEKGGTGRVLISDHYLCAFSSTPSIAGCLNYQIRVYDCQADHKLIYNKEFTFRTGGAGALVSMRGFNYPFLLLTKPKESTMIMLDIRNSTRQMIETPDSGHTWMMSQFHCDLLVRWGKKRCESVLIGMKISNIDDGWTLFDDYYGSDEPCFLLRENQLFYSAKAGDLIVRQIDNLDVSSVLEQSSSELSEENIKLIEECESVKTLPLDLQKKIEKSTERITSIAVDGPRVATCTESAIRIWDIPSKTILRTISLEQEQHTSSWGPTFCILDLDGHLVSAKSNQGKLYIWDALTGELVRKEEKFDFGDFASTFYKGKFYYFEDDVKGNMAFVCRTFALT